MTSEIRFSRLCKKQLNRLLLRINQAVYTWLGLVKNAGLDESRKSKGYHDEPLKGDRWGQGSVRLSRSYRLIYQVNKNSDGLILEILEVNKHDY